MDVREVVHTWIQITLYVPKLIYDINFTYPTSDNLYLPDFILSCTNLTSDKLYEHVKSYGNVFVMPPFCIF